jgi:hypothetical protein
MMNKFYFNAKNLTSNAGILFLPEEVKITDFFNLIEKGLSFDNESTKRINMNHIKTMFCRLLLE